MKTAEDSEDVFTKESPEDVKTAEDVKTKTKRFWPCPPVTLGVLMSSGNSQKF